MSQRPILTGVLIGLIGLIAGCGGSVAPARSAPVEPSGTAVTSSSPPVVPTAAPSTVRPSPTSASSPAASSVFASRVYPYELELPPGVLSLNWKPALRAWDGQARVGSDSPLVDITSTVDGALLVWGLPWNGDVAGFLGLITKTMARFHGCSTTSKPESFEVATVKALAQSQSCAQDTQAATVAMVKDGYGLAFRLTFIPPEKLARAPQDLVGWLDGLTWRTP